MNIGDPSPPRLRGDYSIAGADFVVDQNWGHYSGADHELWRGLWTRQTRLLPGRACDAFLSNLTRGGSAAQVPRFETVSVELRKATGWEIVAVPGLVPDHVFFEHLSQRRFPVTAWLRRPDEFDYIVEPDVFHDFFGHVPLLFDPRFADYMQAYGMGGLKAVRLEALECLARLYWYTVEFGLLRTTQGLRIYGAGILSSGGEVLHSTSGTKCKRLEFRLDRLLRTRYNIDRLQDTYFVIDSFDKLVADTAHDFTAGYERLRDLPGLSPDETAPGDVEAQLASPSK